jgi:hypothetical protein
LSRFGDWWFGRSTDGEVLQREVTPLEGTNMSLFHTIIPSWWSENGMSSSASWMPGGAALAERVWVANRCQQLNAQQISSMPLEWNGPPGVQEPAWVSAPDPALFPNGIGDALFAIVNQLYGWGYSLQYGTDYYADGYPRTWTVISSAACEPRFDETGAREYKLGDTMLDPRRVVQIDRNPTTAAHGTSALRAYSQQAWGLLAAGNQSMTVTQGGIPQAVLKSQRKLTKDQAETLQTQWVTATTNRGGAPPVLPPELDFEVLSINPSDLALLETQEWNSRVLATAYGVPSVILNMALQGGLTYQNPIALMQMWWLTELRTTSKRIMDAFTAQMLPRGQWVSADASDITVDQAIEPSDDPQLAEPSQVAKASPAQQPRPLQAIGGSSP